MTRRIAYPHLTLSAEAVAASHWMVGLAQESLVPSPDFLADWDSSTSVICRREVEVDFGRAASDLDLEKDSTTIAVSVRVGTGAGRLPRSVLATRTVELTAARNRGLFDFTISGEELSAVVDLSTEIALISATEPAGSLSPAKPGDRLWTDRERVLLEGDEQRFPVEMADLREMFASQPQASALWYLHWAPDDWTRDFHGAIRLYINAARPEFVKRVEAEDAATLQGIMGDVMAQLCERLLQDADDEALGGFEDGTVGSQALAWIARAWPGREPAFARSLLQARPGEFRAAFLALAETGPE